jgi:hypothetical protein
MSRKISTSFPSVWENNSPVENVVIVELQNVAWVRRPSQKVKAKKNSEGPNDIHKFAEGGGVALVSRIDST